jgi:hypothetical protein
VKALPLRKEDKNVKTKTNTGITATNVNKANHMEAPTSCPIKYNATYTTTRTRSERKEKCQQQEEFRTVPKGMMALPRQ